MLNPLAPLIAFGKTEDGALIKRIITETSSRRYRAFALAIAMTGVAAACTTGAAYLIGKVVNATYVDRSFELVALWSGALIVLFALKGFATYGQSVATARIGNRITAEVQQRIFDKLLEQNVQYFANRHSTDFMAQAVVGAGAVANILNLLVMTLSRDLLSLIGLIGLMVWQDPVLSLFSLAVMPLALFGVQKLLRRVRRIADNQFSGSASMLSTIQETVQGFKVVKAFNLESEVRDRIAANIAGLEHASNKMARVSNRSGPLLESLGGVAIGLTCLYGGYRVLQTNATPGEFFSFLTASMLAFAPANRLARLRLDLASNLTVARALYALFDTPSGEVDVSDKPPLTIDQGRIELASVAFSYIPGVPVLRDLSLIAEPGRLTALVGPSGGGKTTIFNLLLRFCDVTGGRISIDGEEIGNFSRRSLRSQIAYVGQDIYLFRGTIRENILIGSSHATPKDMIAAAEAALAHDFIMATPDGYDTLVGEAGQKFSLGQRQRIAVARAMIRNAPIVLLDEPTASLDSESEHHVQAAIRRLCAGRTTLAIAHRLNTIRDADCIHVLERGTVIESGSHDELLRRSGRYATLFRLQFPEEQIAAEAGSNKNLDEVL